MPPKIKRANSTKKEVKTGVAAEVPSVATVAELSPTRVSRRSAVVSAQKASPSPSPNPKKKRAASSTSKKSKKTVASEVSESSEKEGEVLKKSKVKKTSDKLEKSQKSQKSSSSSESSCEKTTIKAYLIIYNTLSAMAWALLLFKLAKSFFFDHVHDHEILFQKTGIYLAYLQTVALLEVMHAALGWVRSGVISNVIQIASRLFVIWVAGVYGGSGKHWAYAMMSVAWALSDLTRYAYYLTQLTEASSPLLKWARYNFFLILYPVGTLGEAILIFLARLKMFNYPFLYYGLLTVLACYTPGFLYMYSHMLQQRAKHFSTESSEDVATSVPVKKQKKTKST